MTRQVPADPAKEAEARTKGCQMHGRELSGVSQPGNHGLGNFGTLDINPPPQYDYHYNYGLAGPMVPRAAHAGDREKPNR